MAQMALTFVWLVTLLAIGAIATFLLGIDVLARSSQRAATARRLLSLLFIPRLLLFGVLATSLLGTRYLTTSLIESLRAGEDFFVLDLEDLPVYEVKGQTDAGRAVALFHFAIHSPACDVERFMQESEASQGQVIRLQNVDCKANCHGWVFTGGAYGVRDCDVRFTLEDNGYAPVSEPGDGDLVLYFNDGTLTHSGVARQIELAGPIHVESKWGPFGLYLHPPDKQPLSGVGRFYRSARREHLIQVTPI